MSTARRHLPALLPLVWLSGCDDATPAVAEPSEAPAAVTSWNLEPSAIDFGDVRLGVPETTWAVLTNTGDTDVTVAAIESTTDRVVVTGDVGVVLAPAESATLGVTMNLTTWETIQEAVRVHIAGPTGEDLGYTSIHIYGEGTGPNAGLTVERPDLGEMGVQCTTSMGARVANTGTLALNVTSLEFDDAQGFVLEYSPEEGPNPPPPWTLAPGEARYVNLDFTPRGAGDVLANLTLRSDDQLNPVITIPLTVSVAEGHDATDSWEVSVSESVTALIAVNEVVNGTYADRFQAALPTFFDTLLASGQPYRVAFIHMTGGVVTGSVPYIDETMTAEAATEIALDMVAGASGDNDYLFNTLDLGIDANRAWLSDDDEVAWSTSKLNLVGINSDQEQSSGNATFYVNQYLAEKDDPADIAVHAIGGDDPAGCPGAEAFTPFADAALATGGVFLSICEADWHEHMQTLARAFLGDGLTAFRLSEVPVDGSLSVYVDEVPQPGGWTYYSSSNVTYFDEGNAPPLGSHVRVAYSVSSSCGG